jgi:hypothetical protein
MNYHDVELLNNAENNFANSQMQRRQIAAQQQMEMERLALEREIQNTAQQRYEAQGQHYAQVEANQGKNNAAAIKQEYLKTVMGANATGQMDDAAREQVNKWLASDPDFGGTGLQLAKPTFDNSNPQGKQAAVTQMVQTVQKYRDMAASATDPDQADQYNHLADLIENNLPANVKSASPVRPNETTTKSTDAQGNVTTKKMFSLPGDTAPEQPDDTAATPDLPATTPDTRGILARIMNSQPVPVQQPKSTLTPDDLTPVALRSNAPSTGTTTVNSDGYSTGKLPSPQSQADYDALPPGTRYMHPDGTVKVKGYSPVPAGAQSAATNSDASTN